MSPFVVVTPDSQGRSSCCSAPVEDVDGTVLCTSCAKPVIVLTGEEAEVMGTDHLETQAIAADSVSA